MNNLRSVLLLVIVFFSCQNWIAAQNLSAITIEECYQWTKENYPLVKQLALIDQSAEYNLKNASKGYLPRININGQASYQSAVTSIPINLPNVEIPEVDKDQYKLYVDVYQPLSNRFNIKVKQQQIAAATATEKQQVEIDLYQLKGQVNQIYFSVLLIDAKIKQLKLFQKDINSAVEKLEAAIKNGTATTTDLQLLEVERISSNQKIAENQSNKRAFVKMLSMLTGKNITENTLLGIPLTPENVVEINRPELQLFTLRNQSIDLQFNQIKNRRIPNIGLFLQGGFGRPALNFLSSDFEAYYMGGLKLNWNLSKLYTSKNDKEILYLNRAKINNQKESFLLKTNLDAALQSAELEKYNTLIASDNSIIEIRASVKETAAIQLSNGLITTLDYITFINAENKARQNLVLHEAQLLMAQYHLKTTLGN